ncbi:MAG: hypothetical protein ACPIOQ_02535 [Promethearchaeia archaeon]
MAESANGLINRCRCNAPAGSTLELCGPEYNNQCSNHNDTALLAGVIFEKYILVFQGQIFGFKYKIQEGLKPDRNNAREGRIVGRDAEGARRGLCAACPPRPRGATAAWRPDRLQWQIVQVVPSRPTSVRTQWHTGPGA